MPDVMRNAGEKDRGVAAFKTAHCRHFGNGMALPEIFAQKKRVDASRVTTHDHVLIVVGKNLRLNEVARAEQLGDRACFMDRAQCPRTESFIVVDICSLQSFAGECGEFVAFPKTEMPCDDSKFWVIDGFLSNLQS